MNEGSKPMQEIKNIELKSWGPAADGFGPITMHLSPEGWAEVNEALDRFAEANKDAPSRWRRLIERHR